MITTRTALTTALATALGLGLALAPDQRTASNGGAAVRAGGSCSSGATWKLKAKADDGRPRGRSRGRRQQGRPGLALAASSTAAPPCGTGRQQRPRRAARSVSAARSRTKPGTHRIAFRATNPTVTGNACHGSVPA